MDKIKQFCVKYGALILIFLMCLMLRGCMEIYKSTQPKPEATAAPEAMGGDSFTVGSDAHKRDHIGYGVREAYDKLEALGVDHVMIAEGGVLVPKKF